MQWGGGGEVGHVAFRRHQGKGALDDGLLLAVLLVAELHEALAALEALERAAHDVTLEEGLAMLVHVIEGVLKGLHRVAPRLARLRRRERLGHGQRHVGGESAGARVARDAQQVRADLALHAQPSPS